MKKNTVFISCLTLSLLSQVMVCNTVKASSRIEAQSVLQSGKTFPKVAGKIFDNNGDPIIGASVVVKGTSNGSVTDLDGNYAITNVPQGATLVVTYVGYKPKEIVANATTIKDIVLMEDSKTLNELVVIGYGTQRKADLTGSVANVDATKLNTQSNANIGQALQGKIAGVDIVSQGGQPGSGSRIMVRGIGTLNNASPLYIVDGMYM